MCDTADQELVKCDWCKSKVPEEEIEYSDHFDMWYCEGCTSEVEKELEEDKKYGTYIEQIRSDIGR